MSHESTYQPKTAFTRWLDTRLPIIRFTADFMVFPTPRNINYLWAFGAILFYFLVVQLYSGIILAMHYAPNSAIAFESIEKLMRDSSYGWLMRYTHMVGASLFFFAAYIHFFRGLYYGSYKAPREVLWMIGVAILLCMIATAFMGYSLVWGQMSFWAVTVITNLFSSFDSIYPGLGTAIVQWVWGGFSVDNPTLNRLFSLHYMVPFVLVALVALHIWALHVPGSNNPTGIEVKRREEGNAALLPLFHHEGHVRDRRDGGSVRLCRFLDAELPRRPGELCAGEPAANAASYRAGMVLPAVLCDPARYPVEARRRDRHVRRDRRAVLHSLARYLARPLDPLPPDLPLVLLGIRFRLPGAGLYRLAAGGGRRHLLGPGLHGLLLRILPAVHAGYRPDRDAQPHA